MTLRTVVFVLALAGSGAFVRDVSLQQPPSTEIHLAPLVEGGGKGPEIGVPVNVTNNPGYDNQPYFLPDSGGLLFASNRDGKQTDIYRYDIGAKTVSQVTRTAENEYSPTMTPDGRTFTTVRGAEQRLWRFRLDGSDAGMVWGDRGLIGYHAWISPRLLGVFVLGKPNTLDLIDLQAGTSETVETSIGRSLHLRPGRGTLTFVHKPAGEGWAIKELDPDTRKIGPLTPTVSGSEDFAWTPGGAIVMGAKSKLYAWTPARPEWMEIADLANRGVTAITRLAISGDGRWIAMVSADR